MGAGQNGAVQSSEQVSPLDNPLTPHAEQALAGRYGILLVLGSTLVWSSAGVLIEVLTTTYRMTPLQISAWRVTLAGLILAGFTARKGWAGFRISRRDIPYYVLYGWAGLALFSVVWATSVRVNKAAVATALVFSAPVFVALGDRALFGQRLRIAQAGAIAVNILGCGLVAGIQSPATVGRSPLGLGLGLLSGATFGLYTLLGRWAAEVRRCDALTMLRSVFLFGAVGLLGWGLVREGPPLLLPHLDARGWLLLLGLATGPTLGSYALFTYSLRYLSATLASMVATLEPTFTGILATIFLGRGMSSIQWLGTGLIVGGVMVMRLTSRSGHGG